MKEKERIFPELGPSLFSFLYNPLTSPVMDRIGTSIRNLPAFSRVVSSLFLSIDKFFPPLFYHAWSVIVRMLKIERKKREGRSQSVVRTGRPPAVIVKKKHRRRKRERERLSLSLLLLPAASKKMDRIDAIEKNARHGQRGEISK